MLYYLSQELLRLAAGTAWEAPLSALRLFKYITFRCAGAAVTALILSWWLGPKVIRWLKQLKFGQEYADKAEAGGTLAARLLSKKGTPTMGGILIVLALNFTTLLWARWNTLIQLSLLSVVALTALGFYDDYAKIIQQTGGGARSSVKLAVQTLLAVFIAVYLLRKPAYSKLITDIMVPFYKYPILTGATLIGLLITILTIVGFSNAVNLTDGLDGLAIGCTLIVSVVLQTSWFRYTRRRYGAGRRIFLMAPIHHHFEKKGWYESQVVMRFYILCVLFAVVALSTLKIR